MKPRVHLCVYNHPSLGALDQVWFIGEALTQRGYEFSCSKTLRPDCLNLLTEYFMDHDVELLSAFCRRHGKQIGLVMTEHIELGPDGFSFDNAPLSDTAYIGNKAQRLFGILGLDEHVFGYLTCGELPELHSWSEILPDRRVHRLPYPSIRRRIEVKLRPDHDLVFTGYLTAYRKAMLKDAAARHSILFPPGEETEESRAAYYARAKVALNIPQDDTWPWTSPMRVLFGLRVGIPTVHLGRRDATVLCRRLLEPADLDRAVKDHRALYDRQLAAYEDLVRSAENERFPDGFFAAWAAAEGLAAP